LPRQRANAPWQRAVISRERGGRAYQGDDGGAGAGERDDVEVVGQVELWKGRKQSEREGKEAPDYKKERSASSHLAGVADVSQCGSASFSRGGVPGNYTFRIRGMKSQRSRDKRLGDKVSPPPRPCDRNINISPHEMR